MQIRYTSEIINELLDQIEPLSAQRDELTTKLNELYEKLHAAKLVHDPVYAAMDKLARKLEKQMYYGDGDVD